MLSSTGPVYLFSINTLLSDHEKLIEQENADRVLAQSIETPNTTELGEKLREWARSGFPDFFPVLYISFQITGACSDGVIRSLPAYVEYLTGSTLEQMIQTLEAKLEGIRVSCEQTSNTTCNLRVSKL